MEVLLLRHQRRQLLLLLLLLLLLVLIGLVVVRLILKALFRTNSPAGVDTSSVVHGSGGQRKSVTVGAVGAERAEREGARPEEAHEVALPTPR